MQTVASQIKFDAELCTFKTPFGRYVFQRLSFGLHTASKMFQKYMTHMLHGIDESICYIDDTLIHGKSKEEHDKGLGQVL